MVNKWRQLPGRLVRSLNHRIYRRLVYPRPPKSCSTLVTIAEAFGGSAELIARSTSDKYRRPPLERHHRSYFDAFSSVEITTRILATIPHGRCVSDGAIISPDGKQIARDVSIAWRQTPDEHPLLEATYLPRRQHFKGRIGVAASPEGHTFFHWMFDVLPRLSVLRTHDISCAYVNNSSEFAREWCDKIGIQTMTATEKMHFSADELVVPSLLGRTGTPNTLQCVMLQTMADEFWPQAKEAHSAKRLYLSRRRASYRHLVNEDLLIDNLQKFGFVSVDLDEYTVGDQIQMFRHAEVVVAPHGAGLANCVFCERGTAVIELINSNAAHFCFAQLASCVGLTYTPVFSDPKAQLSHNRGTGRDDFSVSIAQVLHHVNRVCNSK